MFSIGELSNKVGIKIPTIRYYEQQHLMPAPNRSMGNQRRYSQAELDRLSFIKHARDLGFSLKAITNLISLHHNKSEDCQEINLLAKAHLSQVQHKLVLLKRLESELVRMVDGCDNDQAGSCYIIESLAKHELCLDEH